MPRTSVRRTYLELTGRDALRPVPLREPDARVARVAPCTVARYRELYASVGDRWHWHDRLAWSDEELAAYLALATVSVWELRVGDDTAGYFELRIADDVSVEIVYFGLVERYFGRGLGGALLTRAVEEAWALGASRVCLNTCTLDSPRALPNYVARGFRPYREEWYEAEVGG